MPDQEDPRPRPSARLIVLDGDGRILLFRVEDDTVFDPLDPRGHNRPTIVWCTPGGGVEPGESYEEAALRELREETGLTVKALGPCLHVEERLMHFADVPVLLQQRYYLVRASTTVIAVDGQSPGELAALREHRWWTLEELRSTSEEISPPELAEIVGRSLKLP